MWLSISFFNRYFRTAHCLTKDVADHYFFHFLLLLAASSDDSYFKKSELIANTQSDESL